MFWLELFGTTIVLLVGFILFLKPSSSVRAIENFYKNYPLIRYAGKLGFSVRPIFARLIGMVLIMVGLIAIFSWLN